MSDLNSQSPTTLDERLWAEQAVAGGRQAWLRSYPGSEQDWLAAARLTGNQNLYPAKLDQEEVPDDLAA